MTASKTTTIKIPIKPHLKKFLLKTYQTSEPLKVEEDSMIGKQIMGILNDKREIVNTNDQYTGTLTLQLSKPMRERTPRIAKLVQLNTYVEKMFKQALYLWVRASGECGVNPYNATRKFVEFYDFDEQEYTHDAAQRAWLRHKNGEYGRVKKVPQQRHKITPPVS